MNVCGMRDGLSGDILGSNWHNLLQTVLHKTGTSNIFFYIDATFFCIK